MTVPSSLNTPNATASSNDPQGSEAVFPSLDDYIRAYASFIAQLRDHQHEYLSTVAGTVDAITGTTSSGAPNALSAGMVFWFKASGANTSATPTININTIGSKTIKRQDGSALVAGDIPGAGKIVLLGYDGTDMIYLNCPRVTKADLATTATTASGVASGATGTTPATNDNSTKLSTTAFLFNQFTGNQTLGATGYQKFPGGLIVQWGAVASLAASGTQAVTFSPTFSNVYHIGVTAASSTAFAGSAESASGSGFTLRNGNSASTVSFYWFAIGN